MMEYLVVSIFVIWLGPSHLLWFFGGLRYYSTVLTWPLFLLALAASTMTILMTDGPAGVRNYYRYLSGGC